MSCQFVAFTPYSLPSSISAVLLTPASLACAYGIGSGEPCNSSHTCNIHNCRCPAASYPPHSHIGVEMSQDASLPPNAPIVEGSEIQPKINGEEDASSSSATVPASTSSLEATCEDIHCRVSAFLDRPPDSDLTRKVQEQTRISIGVIEKALNEHE